jgi:peptidyl-dipeptidase Dcp
MKSTLTLLITTMLLTAIAPVNGQPAADNPFFSAYNTPFGVPAFDKIKPEHFEPAFEEGIKQQAADITKITSQTQAPTFANTIEALEAGGDLLNRVSTVFFNLNSANTSDVLQKIAQAIAPKLAKNGDDIALNPALFKRVKTVYDQRNQLKLTGEQQRLLEKTYKNFVRGGAALSTDKQDRLRKINEELSVLTLKFGQNLLAENNAYTLIIDKQEDLSGLPASLVSAAATEAKKRNQDGGPTVGKWIFTLQNPSIMPFLQYADNRALREQIFRAYLERGNHNDARDNKALAWLRW